jgi:Domain of unknown function (DUF4375)
MLDITKNNQTELIYYAEIKREEIDKLKAQFDWHDYTSYPNLQSELSEMLFDPLTTRAYKEKINEETLFNALTKPQKVIYALNAFEGQVNNGGIYQFFWNIPEFSLAVEQALEAIQFDKLLENYRKVKEEFNKKEAKLEALKHKSALSSMKYSLKQFFLSIIGKEEKGLRRTGFESFVEGCDEMKETDWFNDYFYDIGKELHIAESNYILKNLDKIALLK